MRPSAVTSKNDLLLVMGPRDHGRCQLCRQKVKFETSGSARGYLVAMGLLVTLCFVQIGWNLHLSQELASVRRNVNFLLEERDASSMEDSEEQIHRVAEATDASESFASLDGKSPVHALAKRSAAAAVPVQSSASASRSRRKKKTSGKRGKKKDSGCLPLLKRTTRNAVVAQTDGKKAIAVHIVANENREESDSILSPSDNNLGNETRKDSERNTPERDGETLVAWKRPQTSSFDTSDLLQDGFIRVPREGYYFVYSQVVFETSSIQHMVSEIGVRTYGSEIFSKCLFTRPNNATPNSYVTCSSNGVVRLREGDGISVKVRPPGIRIYMRSESTYFGAFYIGK